jgi:trans-aconitate 2-methyltransferase
VPNETPAWDPDQYRRFAEERAQPFHDLLALVRPGSMHLAVDLGCGSGELTALAAQHLSVESMLGIDNDAAMLASAAAHQSPAVRFKSGDLASWTSTADHDLIIANASLQWVPNHIDVLARWTDALRPGGQLAVQVPANGDAPTHTVAVEVASSEKYRHAFGDVGPPPDPVATNVLHPRDYARALYDLGYVEQSVTLRVYPHVLPSSAHAVEWVKGTMLTRFKRVLSPDRYTEFVDDYSTALLETIGDESPHFFAFARILMWARRPS